MRSLCDLSTPKAFLTSIAAALLLTASGAAQEDAAPTHGLRETVPGHVAFVDATVVVSSERTVEDATLVVRDGRVVSVEAGGEPPAGARVVDVGGKWIYPGFVDPYTEYGLPREKEERQGGGFFSRRTPPQYEGDRTGARAWNEAIHAERAWIDAFEPDAKAAEPLLERGVTTVQSVRKDGIFRGRGLVATLADAEPNEVVLVPRTGHFLSFDKGSSQQAYPNSQMGSIALIRQTLLDAEWYAQARQAADAAERPMVDRALEALADLEEPVVFDTEDPLALLRAARIGEELGLSLIHVGTGIAFERADEIAALDSPVILSLAFPEEPEVGTYEKALDTSLQDLRRWERAPTTPAVLAERGVRFAFTGHGLEKKDDFFANLRRTVEMGLDESTALAALTTVPAELVGLGEEAGTLETGRRADLVITSGDLLHDDEAKVQAVWIGGEEAKAFEEVEAEDFSGRWAWTVEGQRLEVEVSGPPTKPTVELVEGEERESLSGVEATRDTLSFRAPWGAGEAAGVARFALHRLEDAPYGQVALPDGRLVTADVERLTTFDAGDEGKESADAGDGEPDALLSRLTHPNVAFGYVERPQPETVVVRNATIWTNEEAGVLEGADLLVRDGKIAAVGQGLDAPSGAREVDATGKHVTAGIIDEHSHIAISAGVNEGSHAATAEVRIGDVVDPDDIGIYRALAGGTTAAQLLHGSANPIGGQAQVVKLRWGADAEGMKLTAAPPSIKFALGENVKQSNWGDVFTSRYPQTRMGVEAFMRDRFQAAKEYAAEQAGWEELSDRQRRGQVAPRRDLQLEALAEILAGERLIHCHSYVQSEVLMLIRLAEEMGFTVQTFTHILEGYKVAPEMAEHGAGGSTFSDWWAYKFEVYDAIPTNACLMHEAGVVTSINSDSSDLIRRLNTEAGKMVAHCGLDEQEALKMVTLYPAVQLEIDDRVGSLAAGKDADFVIWSGHPLSEYSRAEQTWVDGAQMFSLERDAELRQQIRSERATLIQKILDDEKPDKDEEKDGGKPDGDEPASPPTTPAQALILGLTAISRRRGSRVSGLTALPATLSRSRGHDSIPAETRDLRPETRSSSIRPWSALALHLGLALVGGVAHAYDPVPGEPQSTPVLLRGGDLYTVGQGVLEATDLLFADGKITAIGKGLDAPPEAEVIDVSGQRVYPGLIALSTTIGLTEIDAVRATRDLDETGSVNPEVMAYVAYDPDSEIIPTVRSEGITTAQVAPQGDLLRGRSAVLHLDGWTREDAGLEPADGLFLSWPRAAVIDAWWMDETPEEQRKQMAEQRTELRETFELARAYAASRDAGEEVEQDLRWEAMHPLWSGEMPLYVRADDYRQILEAVQFASDFGLRMVLVGGGEVWKVADLLARRGIPVVVDSTSGLPYRSEADYDLPGRLPKILHDAGVTVAIGLLDEGWSVRNLAIEGAGRAVAFGLPYEMALRAVTLTPAEILGIDDRQGSLEVGKDATLIVSSGDVLDTLGHDVTHMWIEGRAVDLDNKQKELFQKYRTKIERYSQESASE